MELVNTSVRGTGKVVRRALVLVALVFTATQVLAQAAPRTRPLPAPAPAPAPLPVVPEPVEPTVVVAAPVPTFQEFLAAAPRTPDGAYLVEADIAIGGVAALEAYYWKFVVNQPSHPRIAPVDPYGPSTDLAIKLTTSGVDARWSETQKLQLTYCITNQWHQFAGGFEHDDYFFVEQAVRSAAETWEAIANVNFTHVPAEDNNCNSSNTNVLFRVIPWAQAPYIAAAFFPDSVAGDRSLIINPGNVPVTGSGTTLSGVMLHELGHILGFVHEHGRVATPQCQTETITRRDITAYDSMSVMHYPYCYGGEHDFLLTQNDIDGVRSIYGAVPVPPPPNHAPVARIGSPVYSGFAGRPLAVDGTGSSDADGNTLTYTWNFGDGTGDVVTTIPVASHIYNSRGTFTISLRVNDGTVNSATVTTTAQIADLRWLPAVLSILQE